MFDLIMWIILLTILRGRRGGVTKFLYFTFEGNISRRPTFNSRTATLTVPLLLSDNHPDEPLSQAITPLLKTDKLSLELTFEMERTKMLMKEGNFKTVALQFPDSILHDAAEVPKYLRKVDGVKTYILADTSYGRCSSSEFRYSC
jgi:hypothetical protein